MILGPYDWSLLGVDHVGHRLEPDHPTMKSKLEQMDDETLLVVLGDHGIDAKGDHGGDGELKTSAAMWSKSIPLSHELLNLPPLIHTTRSFPKSPTPYRFIQQIDILPSIAPQLGLPITSVQSSLNFS